jgi:hypothetical protein
VRAEPPRQLSCLLRSGPHDPPTFLTWQLRTVPGGTTLRLQIDELEGSDDDDTWLPVPAALHALLDPGSSRTKLATGDQSGPGSAAPTVLPPNQAAVSIAIRIGQPYVVVATPSPGEIA